MRSPYMITNTPRENETCRGFRNLRIGEVVLAPLDHELLEVTAALPPHPSRSVRLYDRAAFSSATEISLAAVYVGRLCTHSYPPVRLGDAIESNFRVAAVYFRVAAVYFGLRALQRVRQRWWLLVDRFTHDVTRKTHTHSSQRHAQPPCTLCPGGHSCT